jgi:hypothetical protein
VRKPHQLKREFSQFIPRVGKAAHDLCNLCMQFLAALLVDLIEKKCVNFVCGSFGRHAILLQV